MGGLRVHLRVHFCFIPLCGADDSLERAAIACNPSLLTLPPSLAVFAASSQHLF